MSTLTLADGRTYAFEEWGDPAGIPLFWIHGTPGGRLSRHPDLSLWRRLGMRVVTVDRPGYGLSTPLPGRAVSHIAADVAAVADHLDIDGFAVFGGSGGGPHALAVAALLGARIRACVAVCSAAPLTAAEVGSMLDVNQASYRLMHEQGRAGLADFLRRQREQLLADPVAGMRALLDDAPEQDRDWLSRPDVQQVTAESLLAALRPGLDGWVDDGMSISHDPWGFDLTAISCPVRFWHSDDDANAPLSAARRLAEVIPLATLTVWHGQGHTAPSRNAEQVLTDLVETVATGDSRPA
ncbi:MAG TPA: alpha/beta hydrolase [Streptosporangiaceae bacterium]|nr:alpha/beta hydrolase [Streptosporangiaceae bacterium]